MSDADGRSEWLEWRRGGVGASDVAKGHTGAYGGSYGVVAEKRGLLESDIDPADAERGHRWEQPIADGVHALTGYYVHGEQLWVTSPENDRWLATIDGLLDHKPTTTFDDCPALLEVKTSRAHVPPKWDYYESQVNWQMLVCGKQRALIAVAIIGQDPDGNEGVRDLKLRWVERNDFLISRLILVAADIMRHVDADTQPDPDETTRLDDVRQVNRYADPTAPPVELDADLAEIIRVREELKVQHKETGRLLKQADAKIRHALGEHVYGETLDGRWHVRVGQPVRKFTRSSELVALKIKPGYAVEVLDRDRFKIEQPDLYDELKEPSTDRRITVKELDQ